MAEEQQVQRPRAVPRDKSIIATEKVLGACRVLFDHMLSWQYNSPSGEPWGRLSNGYEAKNFRARRRVQAILDHASSVYGTKDL